jgi:hypothetical protein
MAALGAACAAPAPGAGAPPAQPATAESPPILSRVPELQALAEKSAEGALGCGVGTLTLVTSRGRVRIKTGLDPINVFGPSVAIPDLLALLRARIASNQTGKPGPMSGSVGQLGALSLRLLSASEEPEVLEVSAALLIDADEHIRRTAAINLYELGDRRPPLRPEIRKLRFPQPAVQAAAGVGRQRPDWLRD